MDARNVRRRIAQIVCAILSCSSFVCMLAVSNDIRKQVVWTLVSVAVFIVSSKVFFKLCDDEVKNEEV